MHSSTHPVPGPGLRRTTGAPAARERWGAPAPRPAAAECCGPSWGARPPSAPHSLQHCSRACAPARARACHHPKRRCTPPSGAPRTARRGNLLVSTHPPARAPFTRPLPNLVLFLPPFSASVFRPHTFYTELLGPRRPLPPVTGLPFSLSSRPWRARPKCRTARRRSTKGPPGPPQPWRPPCPTPSWGLSTHVVPTHLGAPPPTPARPGQATPWLAAAAPPPPPPPLRRAAPAADCTALSPPRRRRVRARAAARGAPSTRPPRPRGLPYPPGAAAARPSSSAAPLGC
jgi:hypothetical protein